VSQTKNGYIWHTTGSGKTLTSFKASQILTSLPKVKKVVFVVDRKDLDYQTTKELFGECLHKYVITDAIRDENVLKFSVEYVGRYKKKDSATEIDIEVEDIDTKELMESPVRLEKIADYILANHNRKTHSKEFTAMFCVSGIETLIKFYMVYRRIVAKNWTSISSITIKCLV
jgi:type I site-specific restriction-modification system R (restriction) subunit